MSSPTHHPPQGAASRRGAALASLRIPQFRWVFTSNIMFFLGMGGQGIVRPWLALELTDRPLALGIVSAAVAIPMLLLAPFGGVLADRVERRKLILIAQIAVIVSECVILALLHFGRLEFWHMVVSATLMGCAFPLMMPARQAIVVNIVGKRSLGSAMALNMAGVNVTRVAGPAAAGVLIPLLGTEGAYATNVSLYIIAVLCMTGVTTVQAPQTAREHSVLSNLVEGFRYLFSNRLVLILLLYGLIPMFLAMPFQTLLAVFARDVWNEGATGLGILNAAAGIGGVAGSAYVAWRGNRDERLRAQMISVISFGFLLAAFAFCPFFLPALGLVFCANIFVSVFGTLNNTAIQLLIPDAIRGRVSAFLMMSFSLPLLGTLPLTWAAELIGAPMAVGLASTLAVMVAILFHLCSKELRNLDARVRAASMEA